MESMESNITDQQFWSPDSPLAEPHFDEEVTLLSARPVVPIKNLTVKPGFSRPWVFGFALAGALLFGVSATTLYYSRFRTTGSQLVPKIEAVSSGVQGVASESVALDERPSEAIEATAATGAGSSPVYSETSRGVKAQAPSVSWTNRPPNSSNAVSKKPDHRRATVVIDQSSESEYETRDERRAAKREAKEWKANRERRAGKHSNELLRIRDIFEGPPRP
ncbi:MAG: hypothetical protein M3R52_04880 [Acidobacteriota bacterium]|nr:hypothetical protein [Acidobacteriota bacterium]